MSTPESSVTCPCGCVLAAWSMPWPVTSGAAAPWSPAVVHDTAPRTHVYSLFPVETADPELVDRNVIDTDLIDTGFTELPERKAS